MSDLHVDVHDGDGPPLLLVHGFLSSRAQWGPNLAGLKRFCRPIVAELLGHGRSPSPADPLAYAVEGYVAAFEQVRARLGIERWFVLGQSFGAGLTLRYAIEHPRRMLGQIFTNSMSGLAPPTPDQPDARAARAEAFRKAGRTGLEAMPLYPKLTKRWPPEVSQALVDDAALLSVDAIALTIAHTVPRLSVAADLRRLAVPGLLINGVKEAPFQPVRDRAAREIADLEVADLDGGHPVNLDCPEAFNAAVEGFVRRWADPR